MIAKRIIYPGAKLELKTDTLIAKHLFVIKGTCKTIINSQSSLINTGQSITLSEKQAAVLENSGKEPLSIVEINLKLNRITIL